jgi:hypothetical protein
VARPTKYRPEYDNQLIEHYLSFAGEIGVHEDSLYEWEKVHPSFSEAKRLGFAKNRTFWEKLGITHITHVDSKFESSAKLNSTVYIFNMKNRFPKEWRDRTEIKSDLQITTKQLEEMDDNQLLELVEKAMTEIRGK